MSKIINSEEDAKKALGIQDWRHMTKEKVMDFVKMMPNMDKEVSMAAIKQFPNYASMCTNMINSLVSLCNNAEEKIVDGSKEVIEAYKLVLLNLNEELKKEDLTDEKKENINEQMIDIVNKMSLKDTEKNQLISEITGNNQKIIAGCMVLGGVILGVTLKKNKLL